jgi:very-short-patch-repair endonuclease
MRGAEESKTGRARSLRAALTDAEGKLWYHLRARRLTDRNYRILRFWNNDVSRNLVGVLDTIVAALAEAPPHPDR